MKILFLLTQDLDSPSGVGRYFPLARELRRRGHRVEIAALHPDFASLAQTASQQDGVEVHYVAQMHVLKRGDRKQYFSPLRLLWIALRGAWALAWAALRTDADLIQIGKPHPMNSLAGLAAKAVRRKPVFLDCDDHEASSNRYSHAWQQRVVTFFENFTPRHVDHITTHNTFLQQNLTHQGVPPERISYLPNGVDTRRFVDPSEGQVKALRRALDLEGCRVMGYVGSLSASAHAVYLLLDAFERVHRVLPDCVLLVVGGGEEFDALVAETRRRGLTDAVRFTGRVAAADAPLYYRVADVVVDPVYDEPAARGRLPLKLFESWYCGIPFVSGDVGDRRRVLGQPPAGRLAAPGDAEALSAVILSILQDPPTATELSRLGRLRVQDYTWDKLARQLEETYRGHVPHPRRSREPAP